MVGRNQHVYLINSWRSGRSPGSDYRGGGVHLGPAAAALALHGTLHQQHNSVRTLYLNKMQVHIC